MNVTRLLPAAASLLLLCACSARVVNRPGGIESQYAPVNEASRGGVVKYRNQGLSSIREARRRSAYKKMHALCGGPYRIDAEGPRTEGGVVMPGGAGWVDTQYWYIQFSCVHDSTASAPAGG